MPMTRRQLKAMGLPQETIEQLIALHMETVDSLRQERDANQEALQERDALREERNALQERVTALEGAEQARKEAEQAFEDYRAREQEETLRQAREEAATQVLRDRGVHEQAVPLLLKEVPLEQAQLKDGALTNADELLKEVCEKYSAFFPTTERLGIPALNPPLEGAPFLTREQLRGMNAEEINRNWGAVKELLGQAAQ